MLVNNIRYYFIAFLLLAHCSLSAWWDAGHMAVAQIAYEELQPEVKVKVDAYLEAVSTPFPNYSTFVMASIWADDIVHDGIESFFTWHISSRPYDPQGILSQLERENLLAGIEGHDVVWMIKEAKKTLSDPKATSWAKGFMLRFLIHMVGDVHQPMHCISLYSDKFPTGDSGGTRFNIRHEQYTSLHKLFDGAFGLGGRIPERPMSKEDKQYLDLLVSQLKEAYPRHDFEIRSDENIDQWRQESYDIGVNFAYANFSPNQSVAPQLFEEGKQITGRQLALAGYRLGELLNDILGTK